MSADDQQFLDVLSALPNEVKRYSNEVANAINSTVDHLATQARDTLSTQEWIPIAIRPRAATPAPATLIMGPSTLYARAQDWVLRHKLLTGVLVATTGALVYRGYCANSSHRRKRRAQRARNGARIEVVVVAGSPSLPLTRALALDLERRGFIVFVACTTVDEEVLVQTLSRPDIRPLTVDITDPPSAGASIDRFAQFLQTPHAAVPGAKSHYLTLKGVVLIPSLNYQTSPIATIPPSNFADLFNTHLLHPILTIQAFLPLLTAKLATSDRHQQQQDPANQPPRPKVLVLTPSIIASINPPFHAPEATVCSALTAFTDVLAAELRPLDVPVTHLQLGTFDFASFSPGRPTNVPPPPSLLLPEPVWPEPARRAYATNYAAATAAGRSSTMVLGLRGTSLRALHVAVFDVLDGSAGSAGGGVVRVGLGAELYGFVGRFVPRSWVGWMMGMRRVSELASWEAGSPRSGRSEDGEEYVSVADGNVWKEG